MKLANHKFLSRILFCISLAAFNTAIADPPFISDSPEPTEYQHVELFLFGTLDSASDGISLQLPALEADWGFAPDWQLHAIIPVNISVPQNDDTTFGQGDIETSVLYRFLQETQYLPQMAIEPTLELPVGNANQNLGNGQVWMKLPLWMQKTWGSWRTYGGGGYAINSAPQMRNYSFAGWVVQHDLNDKLSLGGELFTQEADSLDSKSYAVFNFGGSYNLNKHFDILVSAGHSIMGEDHLLGYVGIHWTS